MNITGTVSKLAITTREKCVFIPLIRHEYIDKIYEGKNILFDETCYVSNQGPELFFVPFSLPIVGYYDDFGSLKNIEKNVLTERLEKYFNLSIEEIVECRKEDIDNNKEIKHLKTFKKLAGMFEHYDYYMKMVKYVESKETFIDSFDQKIDELALKFLGFEFIREDDTIIKSQEVYVYPNVKNYEIHYKENIIIIYNKRSKKTWTGIYDIRQFIKIWKKMTGYDLYNKKMDTTSVYELLYNDYIRYLNNPSDSYRNFEKLNEDQKKAVLDFLKSSNVFKNDHRFCRKISSWYTFYNLYSDFFKNDDQVFKKELFNLLNFRKAMFRMNTYFIPALSGGQDEFTLFQKTMHEEGLKILNRKIKRDGKRWIKQREYWW